MIGRMFWRLLCIFGVTRILPTSLFVRLQYACWHGGWLHLDSPRDFNEKIQWLKLHYRNPLMVTCADKYEVRKFVGQRIGEKYLNVCLGVYEHPEDIDFSALPESFVLKATQGASWNIICPDKQKLNVPAAIQTMRKWVEKDFYEYSREWQYHVARKRIVCEKFLEDPVHKELRDYKLFTFRGVVKYIWVDYYQAINGKRVHCRNFYDPDWNYQKGKGVSFPSLESVVIPKPECLDELKSLATKLASDFPQCRVDFYVLEDRRIVFGELTFTSFGGCGAIYPDSFCRELGDYIELPKADI